MLSGVIRGLVAEEPPTPATRGGHHPQFRAGSEPGTDGHDWRYNKMQEQLHELTQPLSASPSGSRGQPFLGPRGWQAAFLGSVHRHAVWDRCC